MHDIEPYHQWRDLYIASEDALSPFYKRRYSEFDFSHAIYNYYIHPQWDHFGSNTLYLKVLFADYDQNYVVIELLGEWNDTLHNDIMYLKRKVIEPMMSKDLNKFIFICDNLLNFHASDDAYYEEWDEELRDAYPTGFALFLNTRQHVYEEMQDGRLDHYLVFGEDYNDINWRILKPALLLELSEALVDGRTKRLNE
jgi:hypothetical protein